MSDHFGANEDFEKVDADQEDDITSTSMTGDMAEEDAYMGRSNQNDADLLGDFLSGGGGTNNEAETSEPLMSFGTNEETPVSDASPSKFADSVPGTTWRSEPGSLMQTVDPRETSQNTMDQSSSSENPAESSQTGTRQEGGVLDLIYWRDVKKTGVVFGSMVFVLLSLTFFTILSVLAYLSLAILTVTLSFRVYRNVMQAVQKSNEGHPFKKLLDMDIELKDEVVQDAADKIAANVNNCSQELRRLFLVEDYVDSLKFGLLLWLMTYIGSWFNGMTLVILAVVCIFTLPKVYDTYKGPIDQNVNLVRTQLNNIMAQVSAKIPFPKKKAKTQ